jgi:nitronate monooxygenase
MGTRFIASREAVDTEDRKAALLKAKGDDTIRSEIFDLVWSGSPWPESFNGRAVRNVFVDRWLGNEANLKEHLTEEHARLMEFNARGDLSGGIVWAGESVDLISSILPADTIVEQTVRDAIEMLTGKSTFTLVNSS